MDDDDEDENKNELDDMTTDEDEDDGLNDQTQTCFRWTHRYKCKSDATICILK